MKKNLIFLTLLISVLMVSVVSASISGYLVRGGALADNGYRATLQKVEGTTAIVSVATPDGETEIVRVEEGKTAQVGEVEISASSLTKGTLFRRGGANLNINVVPAETLIKVPGATFLPSQNQTNVTCNEDIINLGSATTFKYWDKKNNVDYHEYLVVNSQSGQSYTLSFRPRFDPGNNRNETDVYNEETGQFVATDKVAGDVITIGDVSFTILEVYVTYTDEWVLLEAVSGIYFSETCAPSSCAAQQCVECNGWLVELEDVPTTFRYWEKKNNIDYHDYLVASDSQPYTLDFRPRFDPGNNRNETDVFSKCTSQFIATDKIAGDVVTIGDVSITIADVFVNATDEYVDLVASSGTYFRKMCVFQ